ncbi:MAG: beta-N-acetylglucosaminidase [Pedobacter sp.]|nr:MAG: beta-N-acetylglucosaminidase [Pedobacter sp.]
MRTNKLSPIFCAIILMAVSLTACAQEHAKNQKKLEVYNAISKNLVLLNNSGNLIPVTGIETRNIAVVSLNYSYAAAFDSLMNKYAKVSSLSAEKYKDSTTLNDLEDELKFHNLVVVSIESKDVSNQKFMNFINNVAKNKQVIIALFGAGSGLSAFDNLNVPIVWSESKTDEAALVVPQVVFGGIAATGKLTRQFSSKFSRGSGFNTNVIRLKYSVPEDAGVNADDLAEIDAIAAETIREKAAPGLVVLVAKAGKVIFNKAYGYHTYENLRADKVTDIFDMASVTKVTATTPSVMRLVEQNRLKLDTNVGAYIPKARNTPMRNTVVRDVMLHQAGFIPYIPFHNFIKEGDYSRDSTAVFQTKVADNYFVKKEFFTDLMWPRMLNSPIKTQGAYVYSDISMYVMKDIVEHITEEPITKYTYENFYLPLGMQTAGFLPRNRFPKDRIVPTEDDKVFRKTLLVGYVHDQGAALAGGVAGHAGLFATANDLAIFYQMLLNKGTYGGTQYFKPETVTTFTSKQSDVSRRGLGFDRWDPKPANKYPSELASPETYGHTGYTGIGVWVDPSRDMIYIFLSNRVNPSVSEKLGNLAIRRRVQDVINKAIDKGRK